MIMANYNLPSGGTPQLFDIYGRPQPKDDVYRIPGFSIPVTAPPPLPPGYNPDEQPDYYDRQRNNYVADLPNIVLMAGGFLLLVVLLSHNSHGK
jgi:hypothetical protein